MLESRRRQPKLRRSKELPNWPNSTFCPRYPTALERALNELGHDPADAKVQPRERSSIEAKMIRFRYGPWDARYRRWLGLLAARGIVNLGLKGNTVTDWPFRPRPGAGKRVPSRSAVRRSRPPCRRGHEGGWTNVGHAAEGFRIHCDPRNRRHEMGKGNRFMRQTSFLAPPRSAS